MAAAISCSNLARISLEQLETVLLVFGIISSLLSNTTRVASVLRYEDNIHQLVFTHVIYVLRYKELISVFLLVLFMCFVIKVTYISILLRFVLRFQCELLELMLDRKSVV